MKKCPQCAEDVQDEAKVCRYCNHSFSAPILGFQKPGCIMTGFIAVALLYFAGVVSDKPTNDPIPLANPNSADCEKVIQQGMTTGMIRERPSAHRIDVEDRLWAAFPAPSKRGLALAVRCVSDESYGVVYGYRSGKRLAMATSVGVDFE